jgi:hypothetical protein
MAPLEKTPEAQASAPKAADVYATHDQMVKDTYQKSGKYDMKAASKIVDDMQQGKVTPQEAMKSLTDLGGEPKTDTTVVARSMDKSKEIRQNGDVEQANSIYEEIMDYQGTFTRQQKDTAAQVLTDMRSGKLTGAQAVNALSKI